MKVVDNIYIQRVVKEACAAAVKKEALIIGAGDCATDFHLIKNNFNVISTDYREDVSYEKRMKDYKHLLNYHIADLFELDSFPVENREIVVCMEVLEHLTDYKKAFKNLLTLTEKRLIIGVPWRKSFNDTSPPPVGHCNYWDLDSSGGFKDIHEFKKLSEPYQFYVEKILTKPEDAARNQAALLIIVDKE